MEILLFLKPITDMLWQYKILDMILLALSIGIFLINLPRLKGLNFVDFIVVILCILFTTSLLRNTEGFQNYVKIISGFLYYFLGRIYYKSENRITQILTISSLIVVTTNIIVIIIGRGVVLWGNAITLKGAYYYKTDLAVAMIQSTIFIYFAKESKNIFIKILRILYTYVFIPLIIIFTNSRMYLIILIVIVYIFYKYKREIRRKVIWRIKVKELVLFLCLILLGIYSISLLSKTELFTKLGFISFNFEKFSDLFSPANSQGRSEIWSVLLRYFFSQPFKSRFIGIDLVTDSIINPIGHNAHNSYLKILFSIGFIGSILFLIFIYQIIKYINRLYDRQLFYISLSLIFVYIISGFSGIVIEFTQLTWIPMFYVGVAISNKYTGNKTNKVI